MSATQGARKLKMQIPWQVRSAALIAHPEASWQSYMPWEPDTWIVVTMTDDKESRWWLVTEAPAGEFSIVEVERW
jgi:hypothetical protein